MAQMSGELAAPISTVRKASRPSTTRRVRKPQPLPPPVYTRAKLILTPQWKHQNQERDTTTTTTTTTTTSPCLHDQARHDNHSSEEDTSDERYLRRHRRERLRLWRQASVAIARQKRSASEAVLEDASKEDFSRDEDEIEDEGVSNHSELQYNYDTSKPWQRPDHLIRIVKGPCKWKEPVVEKSKTCEFAEFQKRSKKRNKSRTRRETSEPLDEFPSFLDRKIRIELPEPSKEQLQKCRRLQLMMYHLNLLRHLSMRRHRGMREIPARSSTGGGGAAVGPDTGAGANALRVTNSIRMKALRKVKSCIRRYKGKQLLRETTTPNLSEDTIPKRVDARVSAAAVAAAAAASTLAQS